MYPESGHVSVDRQSATPTGKPARPRGEARRDCIVEAALAVIAEVGPDALTHRRVATNAGVPLAATTYWFSSKEDLVRAAIDRAVDRDLARLAERATATLTWTRATVAVDLALMLHAELTEDPATARVDWSLWMEAIRRPELRVVAARWADAYLGFYGGVLRRIDPAVTDLDVLLISSAINGLMAQELTHERPDKKRRLTKLLGRLLDLVLDPARP
jgi:DNA-binding transcriptional regulator YbjK